MASESGIDDDMQENFFMSKCLTVRRIMIGPSLKMHLTSDKYVNYFVDKMFCYLNCKGKKEKHLNFLSRTAKSRFGNDLERKEKHR